MALIWGRQSTWVLSEEQKQEICRRYKAGTSMRKLAKRYGLRSHNAIYSIARTQQKRRQART
jgi:Mor family transcriptional regulator